MGNEPGRHPRVIVDVVIFTLRNNDLQTLLVQRSCVPGEGLWVIPGRPIGCDELLNQAALGVLEGHTGLVDVYLEQLYTFDAPDRSPTGWAVSVAYVAVVPQLNVVEPPDGCVSRSAWWSMGDLPPLAFDHASMLDYALVRLRYKLEYTAVGFELLPDTFTLSELQLAYEAVLGEELDKRNFRRKILGAGVIEPSGGHRTGEGRPARLYRYRKDAVAQIKARRLFP